MDDTPTYRYRLTVEVETPEGLRTGSSVIEVDTQRPTLVLNPSAATVRERVRGEAVAVDLPGGRVLFALLRSEGDLDWAGRVMLMLAREPPGSAEDSFQAWFDNMLSLTGTITLPKTWPRAGYLDERPAYPMLVTFNDLADPTSLARVDPDSLAASFGERVRLKRITAQITDDPVTTGIVVRLPWLDRLSEYRTDPTNPFTNRLPGEISALRIGQRL